MDNFDIWILLDKLADSIEMKTDSFHNTQLGSLTMDTVPPPGKSAEIVKKMSVLAAENASNCLCNELCEG